MRDTLTLVNISIGMALVAVIAVCLTGGVATRASGDEKVKSHGGMSGHVLITPADLEWADAPPSVPSGAKLALLEGDPKNSGQFTMRIKFPAGYKIPPHWHSADEHATVLSGALYFGVGDKFDSAEGKKLTAGGFSLMPAKTNHFAWTDEETIIQVHGIGPWTVNYVNP